MLLLLIIAVLAGAYFLPAQIEGTPTACDAVNARVRTMVEAELAKLPANSAATAKAQGAATAAKAQMPGGPAITALIQARLPAVPPQAGCAAAYWATQYWSDIRTWIPALPAGRP
ncbi:MAG: hypothetical protein NT133_21490 [Alphaproteobacteria bacterium]|nr:hypothetical protein [Alphaproteobacteria bacterium]